MKSILYSIIYWTFVKFCNSSLIEQNDTCTNSGGCSIPLEEISQGSNGEIIRDYLPLPGVPWRYGGAPNYATVNKAYFEGRMKKHPFNSLEATVQKLVKNWEVEAHHIEDINFWQTMKIDVFSAIANNIRCPVDAAKMAKIGPYNVLLGEHQFYNATNETYDTANDIFKTCFSEGFPWEVLEVHSAPPNVSFTWRHWGKFTGPYRGSNGTIYQPTGENIELFGNCIARVTSDLQITALELYYDRDMFLKALAKNVRHEDVSI